MSDASALMAGFHDSSQLFSAYESSLDAGFERTEAVGGQGTRHA